MEKITISQISRKQQPSKNNPGTTYTITNVKDANEKVYSAFGRWAEGWKEGDIVEANVVEKEITGFDGFSKKVFNLENPNPLTNRFGPRNLWPQAYDLALNMAVNTKDLELTMDVIDRFAVKFKSRLENGPVVIPSPITAPVVEYSGLNPDEIPF